MMARIETTAFHSADYLNTAQAIAAYLDAYQEDSTPEELRNALATVARSHGISDLARRSALSCPGKSTRRWARTGTRHSRRSDRFWVPWG
jgi:DNA-binding phage protein